MSNTKRRDNKGRVLQMGESQQEDGRYVYRYMTPFGQRKAVYSWRLTATDPTPTGKRKEKSLREKIKDIEKQLRLETFCEDLTVCELVEKYLMTKTGVKHSTRTGYKFVQNILAKEDCKYQNIRCKDFSDKNAGRWQRLQYHTYGARSSSSCISDGGR